MGKFNNEQRYKVTFFPEEDLTEEELHRGRKEAARQLHAIHEYPWKGLPEDIKVADDYENPWTVHDDGRAERICETYAHAIQVDTFLGIVEGYYVEMEPYDGD